MTTLTGLGDTMTLAQRMLKHNVRSPDTIMTVLGMPLMFLLAFVFVLGGAMDTGPIRYVDFVVPPVLLFCIAAGVAYTAFRVYRDVTSGMYARFWSMPIARWAVTAGHMVASVIVNGVSVAVLLAVAFAIGYRPKATLGGWLVTVAVLVAALVAFSLMGVAFGLVAKTEEGASMFVYLMIGLLFVSSGFAPTATMAAGLRAFADHQPMTPLIDAIRSAQLGAVDPGTTWLGLAWLAAIAIAFGALANLAGRRRASA
ncbi:MAG: ABC transporter permease [Bifidobacteriaceae bacterium]|jgi:ABC-2 type transport system permease protein|nr:ABC transporter permease [Bifidobacteriaceae bacterium]